MEIDAMKLYGSAALQNKFEVSYPVELEINNAKELKEVAAETDYCMAKFRDGYTCNGKFVKAHLCAADFMYSNVLYADIDNDGCTEKNQYSIYAFQRDFAEWEYYITTSKSHQKGKNGNPPLDRYHVLFPLECEVSDAAIMKDYLRTLQYHFFGKDDIDPSCIDVARKFFGNPTNESIYHQGKSIQSVIENYWKIECKKDQQKRNKDKGTYRVDPVTLPDSIKAVIIPSLDKAYSLGWFGEYRNWIILGMALKEAGYDITVWLRYCNSYEDIELAKKKWETFNPDGTLNGMKYLYAIHQKLAFRIISNK
jgi:hypothetical protein